MSNGLTTGRIAALSLSSGLECDQIQVLMHTVGLSRGESSSQRNHFVAGERDIDTCRNLAKMLFMTEHSPSSLSGGDPVFTATTMGVIVARKMAVEMKSMDWDGKPMTRSKRRYNEYLEADCDLTFGDWLKMKAAQARIEKFGCDPGPDRKFSRKKEKTDTVSLSL